VLKDMLMKSIIISYSFSGNTRKVAVILAAYLKQEYEVHLCDLQALDESRSFFSRAIRAFKRERGVIQCAAFSLNDYDLVCVGTPVWAFSPASAMNTYLDKCSGLEGKNVILFTTYGSGTGNKRCLDYMQTILAQKGVSKFKRFSIQQGKAGNRDVVLAEIKKLFP
jgi:flavodoxin